MNEATATQDAIALAAVGLSHDFGPRRALDDVSFDIRPGEFAVLLGRNGAGKTTLFSLITRLYANRVGAVRVFGFDVRTRPGAALSRIGVVFQQRTLDLDLTLRQNLLYHAALHGMAAGAAKRRAAAELDRVGLGARSGEKVRHLSGGQVRRVEIARALLHEPRLLLLDEPTVGLDVGARQDILDHVRGLVRDRGLAVLWATHLIDEVGPEDGLIVLHQGRIVARGRMAQVVAQAGAADIREAFTRLTAAGGQ